MRGFRIISPMKFGSLLLVLCLGLIGCGETRTGSKSTSELGYEVFVSNYPLGYMVSELTSGEITPDMPWAGQGDPAYWKPSEEAVSALQESKLVVFNGAEYEKWAKTLSLPKSKIVDTSASFKDSLIEVEGEVHTHGPEGEHSHTHKAITTWLDMNLAREHLKAVFQALIDFKVASKDTLERNFTSLDAAIADMDSELKKIGKTMEGKAVFGSHPIYQYLAKAYGINIIELHLEPGEFPSESQWDELKRKSDENEIKYILWEGEPLVKTREKLDSIGITSLTYSPCGDRPEEGDFISVMETNIRNLASVTE